MTKPDCYTAANLQEMWQIATQLAERFRTQGGVIALHGELGAGKTTLAQGIAAALGVTQAVTSPTFALVLEYPLPDGRYFVHMDLYRLAGAESLEAIGFEEYLESDAVIVIEWADRAEALLPPTTQHVAITIPGQDSEMRKISLQTSSPCHHFND